MTIEKIVMIMAGAMILMSLALAYYVSQTWLLLTAFVGLNLIVSGVTGFCPMVTIFRKMGFKHGCAFK